MPKVSIAHSVSCDQNETPFAFGQRRYLNCSNNNNTSFAVTEAQARIHDTKGGDIMVKRGSTIELNCTVESGDRAHHSLAVFWYLEDRVIDWMGQTGHGRGVQVSQQERLPIVTSI